MKRLLPLIALAIIIASSCVSQKKLAYLGPAPGVDSTLYIPMDVPYYVIKPRDMLYLSAKAMGPDGTIKEMFSSGSSVANISNQGSGLLGTDVDAEGYIYLPVVGGVKVSGLTLLQARKTLQESVDKVFRNTTVECKLLGFSYTVIGEVKSPGTFASPGNYMTLLDALGHAGGLTDVGRRDRILIARPYDGGTKTYRVNLQDNKIFTSEAYTILPNDVIIVEASKQKVLLLNMPTFGAFVGILTTILLFLNYTKK
jgi:polysaccharide export outer membrane protein